MKLGNIKFWIANKGNYLRDFREHRGMKSCFFEYNDNTEKDSDILKMLPSPEEIKVVLNKITDYYSESFEFVPEFQYQGSTNICFYVFNGGRQANGECIPGVDETWISINFCDLYKDKNKNNTHYEIFKAKLWTILAHEMYHAFQVYEFYKKGRKGGCKSCNDILEESLAQYFALCFAKKFINDDGEDCKEGTDNFKKLFKMIVDEEYESKRSYAFGIGRKKLMQNKYSKEEISEDDNLYKELNRLIKENNTLRLLDTITPSEADYGGGYVLYQHGQMEGVQGKNLDLYTNIFNTWINDDETALKLLIDEKEKIYKNIYSNDNPAYSIFKQISVQIENNT